MNILIIDDEKPARTRIRSLLADKYENLNILEASTINEAICFLKNQTPDVMFLDIDLGKGSGFDILNTITTKEKPIVIFASAYDSFAMKAFDFQAFDFLLKPFHESRFYKAFENARNLNHIQKKDVFEDRLERLLELKENKEKKIESLPIKLGNKTIFISVNNIKYIIADRYYAEIYTADGKHVMRQSLSSLIEILDTSIFARVHRSTIINMQFIQEIIHSDYSEIDIKMKDGKQFRVSRTHKKELLESLGI